MHGLIAARREGLASIADHPDGAADITARAYSNPNTALFRTEMRNLPAVGVWSDGRLDCEGMHRMVEGLRITGQLTPG